METVRGIPVQEVLSKADPVTDPKLVVVRGFFTHEDEDSNWAVDQVIREIRGSVPALAISDQFLPAYRIFSGVSNDPDSESFAPGDQFPIIIRAIMNSDIVLFATRERCGFPDSNTVGVIERLGDLAHYDEKSNPLLENKPAGIVVTGGYGAAQAALALSGALNKLGLTVVRHGLAAWDTKRGDPKKSERFGECLTRMAHDLTDLCKALHR